MSAANRKGLGNLLAVQLESAFGKQGDDFKDAVALLRRGDLKGGLKGIADLDLLPKARRGG